MKRGIQLYNLVMKKILITGASDGIGKALVDILKNKDYQLYLFGRTESKLNSIEGNNIVKKYCFDMKDKAELNKALDDIVEDGGVDILINNAGANLGKASVLDMDIETFEDMMSLNVVSHVMCIQKLGKLMLEKKEGQIVNILSSACLFNNPGMSGYTASKKAMEAVSKALVKEVKDKGVKVLDVYPGGVDTNFRVIDRPDYLRPETIAKHIVYAIENNEDGMFQEIVCRPVVENNY